MEDLKASERGAELTEYNHPQNLLFFTRFENDTGGDQTLLLMVFSALLKNLPERSNVNLVLVFDSPSAGRAESIAKKWRRIVSEKGCDGVVWLNCIGEKHPGRTKLLVDINQEIMGAENWSALLEFIQCSTVSSSRLDIFIIAGWAHQLDETDAYYMLSTLLIPCNTKLLMCVPPGSRITTDFLNALRVQGYGNVFYLQPGLELGDAGFPMPASLNSAYMESQDCRNIWVEQIRNQAPATAEGLHDGEPRGDKLIVIYCSKDKPGTKGRQFMAACADEVLRENAEQLISEGEIEGDLNEYHVILIGANDTNEQEWVKTCQAFQVKSVVTIGRTESSEVLMRSLRDAKFSMATGSFSILEAKKLGIMHCAYLCPPHLKRLGGMLESRSELLGNAFEKGDVVLQELQDFPNDDFTSNVLCRWSPMVHTEGLEAGIENGDGLGVFGVVAACGGELDLEQKREITREYKVEIGAVRLESSLHEGTCDIIDAAHEASEEDAAAEKDATSGHGIKKNSGSGF